MISIPRCLPHWGYRIIVWLMICIVSHFGVGTMHFEQKGFHMQSLEGRITITSLHTCQRQWVPELPLTPPHALGLGRPSPGAGTNVRHLGQGGQPGEPHAKHWAAGTRSVCMPSNVMQLVTSRVVQVLDMPGLHYGAGEIVPQVCQLTRLGFVVCFPCVSGMCALHCISNARPRIIPRAKKKIIGEMFCCSALVVKVPIWPISSIAWQQALLGNRIQPCPRVTHPAADF